MKMILKVKKLIYKCGIIILMMIKIYLKKKILYDMGYFDIYIYLPKNSIKLLYFFKFY
jgi:hypothetical protein